MRHELLEDNSIENLEHARLLVDLWSRRYNDFHPHSSLGYLTETICATMETRKHGQHLNHVDLILRPLQWR